MTLSVYDPIKNCFVLRPKEIVINAFHPDFVKTHMPEFMSDLRIQSAQHAQGVINGGKSKEKRESKNKAAFTTNTKKVDLAVKDYYTYARAGLPKGVKK